MSSSSQLEPPNRKRSLVNAVWAYILSRRRPKTCPRALLAPSGLQRPSSLRSPPACLWLPWLGSNLGHRRLPLGMVPTLAAQRATPGSLPGPNRRQMEYCNLETSPPRMQANQFAEKHNLRTHQCFCITEYLWFDQLQSFSPVSCQLFPLHLREKWKQHVYLVLEYQESNDSR